MKNDMANREEPGENFWVTIDYKEEIKKYGRERELLSRVAQDGTTRPVHGGAYSSGTAPGIFIDSKNLVQYAVFDDAELPVDENGCNPTAATLALLKRGGMHDVFHVIQGFDWIKYNVPFVTTSKTMYRIKKKNGDSPELQRLGTPDELMAEFNKQVIEYKPMFERLAQESRMLDKSAAMLIAGAGCLSIRGNVWVDCNMESEWFDSSDEKNLMKFAWSDVIGKDTATFQDTFQRLSGEGQSKLADDQDWRLAYITKVLKSFRKTQLTMQLYSLSPGTEAVLSALVLDAIEEFPQLSVFGDTHESMERTRTIVSEHDDRVRRLSRILRRTPFTRNEFCRVAGNNLRYQISLQEGVAISTRRLNQIQLDMRNADGIWKQFLYNNIQRILDEVRHCWDNPESFYVFDWTTHRMKILDSEQYSIDAPSYNGTVEEEVMYQQSCGSRTCKYPLNPLDDADMSASVEQTSAYGKIPRTRTPRQGASPYVNN
jgi:hypothetical protein